MSIAFSSKGVQDYSVSESVSPYTKAVVATTSDQDACRAIYVKVAGAYDLTVDGKATPEVGSMTTDQLKYRFDGLTIKE